MATENTLIEPKPEAALNLFSTTGALREWRHKFGAVRPVARAGQLAPAFAQERVWQFAQAAQASPYFNVALAWKVTGPLEFHALEQALNVLWQRHEILRSSFQEIGGELRVTLREEPLSLKVLEAAGEDGAARRAVALEQAQAELRKPFHLERDSLFEAVLIRQDHENSLLLLKVHQIVFDGSSMPVLARELKEAYAARLRGAPARLPNLPIQYYDFAAWHRHLMAEELVADQEAFWRARFAQPYAPLPLGQGGSDHGGLPRPAKRTELRIPPPVCATLMQLAARAQTTLFDVLLAGFHAWLYTRTGREDTLVFATVAGRHQPELRNLVGLVANVLPFRTRLSPQDSFREAVRKASDVAAAALANQLLPLGRILRHIKLAGPKQAGGVFQAMFIYQNGGLPGFAAGATTFEPLTDLDNGSGRFGILLDLRLAGKGVEGEVKYRSDMFGPEFGPQFAEEFSRSLQRWGSQPEQRLNLSAGLPHETDVQASLDRAHPPTPAHVTPPDDALEQSLVRIWEKVLKISPIGVQDDFFSLGGDSFLAVHLMVEIEKLAGKSLPAALPLQAPTVEKMAQVLRGQLATSSWKSLVPIKSGERSQPLYFVHGEGGKIVGFHSLARHLAEDQPVYGLQSVGLDGQDEPFTSIEAMAAHYVREIREFQPQGPYALSGLSFGGMVAYEMAQQLVAQGQKVSLLAVLDTFPPVTMANRPLTDRCRHELEFQLRRILYHGDQLLRLPWPEKANYVRTAMRTLRERFQSSLWQWSYHRRSRKTERLSASLVNVTECNNLARDTYHYRPYSGRVTWFRAMEEGLNEFRDPEAAWRVFALGGLEVHWVPGNHVSMTREPHAATLAQNLQDCLDRASGQTAPAPDPL